MGIVGLVLAGLVVVAVTMAAAGAHSAGSSTAFDSSKRGAVVGESDAVWAPGDMCVSLAPWPKVANTH